MGSSMVGCWGNTRRGASRCWWGGSELGLGTTGTPGSLGNGGVPVMGTLMGVNLLHRVKLLHGVNHLRVTPSWDPSCHRPHPHPDHHPGAKPPSWGGTPASPVGSYGTGVGCGMGSGAMVGWGGGGGGGSWCGAGSQSCRVGNGERGGGGAEEKRELIRSMCLRCRGELTHTRCRRLLQLFSAQANKPQHPPPPPTPTPPAPGPINFVFQ